MGKTEYTYEEHSYTHLDTPTLNILLQMSLFFLSHLYTQFSESFESYLQTSWYFIPKYFNTHLLNMKAFI